MSNYSRGDYYEKRALAALREAGYVAWQARGSKGAADVIAVKPAQLLLVQVKGASAAISGEGWNALRDLAEHLTLPHSPVLAVVADTPARGVIRWRRITGAHRKNSQQWPSEPLILDEIAAAPAAYARAVAQ